MYTGGKLPRNCVNVILFQSHIRDMSAHHELSAFVLQEALMLILLIILSLAPNILQICVMHTQVNMSQLLL